MKFSITAIDNMVSVYDDGDDDDNANDVNDDSE